jgi:predicted ATPase/class 3 adenylate cyclase
MGVPTGTVTFLFTDIEGSTRRWEEMPETMRDALARHDEAVRSAIEGNGGYVFATGGDGFAAAFDRAGEAVAAAVEAQGMLNAEAWPEGALIRVRMGLHTGEAVERAGDYFGTPVNRAARLMALAHGGQVLCSATTAGLVEGEVPLVDLGEHRLRDLSIGQRVFQVGSGAFPPLRSLDAVMGNLPAQLSSFVGREGPLREVVGILGRERLITLTGPGGVGKTRLALQAAADMAATFADGVWLVELASVRGGADVPAAVSAVLRVPQQPGRSPWGSVCDACKHRTVLLLLDNCEHLVDELAGMVTELLASAPAARVLATSRQALGVRGERQYPVAPLRTDDEAVALFVDRAQAVKPGFTMTDANARAVAEVCRHLDGIPLALELAAARVASMTPDEIFGRLDERFRLLRAATRAEVQRHQTLRAAIDWSYDALAARDRHVFTGVAVFAGGFTAAAAQVVLVAEADAWDVLEALESLVAKSLLGTADEGGATRYQMLETVRHYAAERLAEVGRTDELRRAHAEWVADFVESEAGPGLRGPSEAAWVQRLAAERDNVVAAIEWAAGAGQLDIAARMIAALGWHATMACQLALTDIAALAFGMPGIDEHPLFPEVAGAAAVAMSLRGETMAAIAISRRAIAAEHPGGPPSISARNNLVLALLHAGEADEAFLIAEEAVAATIVWGDPWLRIMAEMSLVGMAYNQRARSDGELAMIASGSVESARVLGNPTALAGATFERGVVNSEHDPKSAIRDLEESLRVADGSSLVDVALFGVIGYLCRCYAAVGSEREAAGTVRRGLLMARERGSPALLAQVLDYGAQALIALGHDDGGVALLEAASGGHLSPRALGGRLLEARSAALDLARARLGPERYERAKREGEALTPETATAFALGVLDDLSPASARE